MDHAAQSGVRVEEESGAASAMVCGGGELGGLLEQLLASQGLRVVKAGEAVSEVEIRYVFFLASELSFASDWRGDLSEALSVSKKGNGKFLLVLDDISAARSQLMEEVIKESSWPCLTVEINGSFGGDRQVMVEAAGKIVRLAFSGKREGREVILSQADSGEQVSTWGGESKQQRGKLIYGKKGGIGVVLKFLAVLVVLAFLPLMVVVVMIAFGLWQLGVVKEALSKGEYQNAAAAGSRARESLENAAFLTGKAEDVLAIVGVRAMEGRISGSIDLLAMGARTAEQVVDIQPKVLAIVRGLFGQGQEIDWSQSVSQVELSMGMVDQQLGVIEGELRSGRYDFWLGLPGVRGSKGKVQEYVALLSSSRRMVREAGGLFSVLPEVLGKPTDSYLGRGEKKTYLIVFQNTAELRPTGGFIGSYGVVHTDSGRILDYKINDIYAADNQLRGRISPPDEILHFLGQPNWFMRDANFAADFPLTAKRLEWFLEKETGQSVDGVVAVNLGAVQKALLAVGPVQVEGVKGEITAENLFEKAEFAAEINFFPGSTQKRDFLGMVGEKILEKVTSEGEKNWMALGKGLQQAIDEKDILVYFNLPVVEDVMRTNDWAGALVRGGCDLALTNCFSVVSANFGANKANYFLKEDWEVSSVIGKGGKMDNTVVVNLSNLSPSESWPGGKYKDYLRFLVPNGSELTGVDLGDGRVATVSSVLTAEVLSRVSKNHFLVFKSSELALTSENATSAAYQSYGMLVEVPVGQSRQIVLKYRPPLLVDFSSSESVFDMTFLKQPGSAVGKLTVDVEYPDFLQPVKDPSEFGRPLVSSQKLVYNTDLSVDRKIKVKFRRE